MAFGQKTKEQLIWEFKSAHGALAGWLRTGPRIKSLDEALRRQAALLQEQAVLLDLANDSIMVRNMDDRILFFNRSAERNYGWSRDEALGQVSHLLLSTEFPEPRDEVQIKLMRDERWEGELTHTARDGRRMVVLSLWTLRRSEDGLPQAVLEINRDITERKRREQQLLAYQTRLRALAAQLAKAEESERHRIATDLHDGVGQYLAMCKLRLKMFAKAHPEEEAELTETVSLLGKAIAETRSLIADLSPPVLYELGLEAGLQWLAERERGRFGLDIALAVDRGLRPLGEEVSVFLFRAAAEFLLNVFKHAGARRVEVALTEEGGVLRLKVADDGRGLAEPAGEGARAAGFGLFSIRERAESLGGRMELESRPGRGLAVSLRLPLPPGPPTQK